MECLLSFPVYALKSSPPRRWSLEVGLWEVRRLEGGAPTNGISVLRKRPQGAADPFVAGRTPRGTESVDQGSLAHPLASGCSCQPPEPHEASVRRVTPRLGCSLRRPCSRPCSVNRQALQDCSPVSHRQLLMAGEEDMEGWRQGRSLVPARGRLLDSGSSPRRPRRIRCLILLKSFKNMD